MNAYELNPFIRYIDLRHCSVSYKTPLKAYDYRLFAIVDGECTVNVEGQEISLCKDACLIIPPNRIYRFIFNEHAPATLYNINFSLSYIPLNGRAIRPTVPEYFHPEHMPEAPDPAFFPTPTLIENAPEIIELVSQLMQERDQREIYFNEICSAMLKRILLQLMRLPKAGAKPVPMPVTNVKHYLEEHCRETITGDQLGKIFGYHPFYLNRLFRQHTGQTIHLYQMQCRMKAACTLLITTNMNIKEIADSLGFSSASYFSELFKKLRGVSPVDYRNGMR